jgi:hypothetical protein
MWLRRCTFAPQFVIVGLLLIGCAGTPYRLLLPHEAPSHSLALAQIMVWIPRDTLVQRGSEDYQLLLDAGISDADIGNQTVAIGRINCCHEPTEKDNAIAFYVAPAVGANVLDIVEIELGRIPAKDGKGGEPNKATRVIQRKDSGGPCRWEPPQTGTMRAYGSVLYCDWMRGEGWVAEGPAPTIHKTWIKKP